MTESKFKAWSTLTKDFAPNTSMSIAGWAHFIATHTSQDILRKVLQAIVWVEYTGFLDRNGKEIYEGDIMSDGQSMNRVVIWDDRRGMWALDGADLPSEQLSHHITQVVYIGNKYENPELLEKIV